jgi:putative oxidoreductase
MDVSSELVLALSVPGRILLAAMLLHGGVRQFKNRTFMRELAQTRGVPLAHVLVPASTALVLVAAVMLVLGAWVDLAALATLAFYIATLFHMHAYWRFEGEARSTQFQNFVRNLSLAGGSILCAVAFIGLEHVPLGLTDTFFRMT